MRALKENKQIKVNLIFKCNMVKEGPDGEIIRPFEFHSKIEVNLEGTDENELYNNMIDTIEEKIQKLENAPGTGWHLQSVINLELHTVEWEPLRGSSYIELPKELKDIKNDDDKCFIWCVLRALYPKANHPERLDKTLKSEIETLNTTGIEYPVSLQDIKKFECLNSNISITVFGYNEKDKVFPLRISEHSNRSCKIKLLLVEKEGVSHYCLIENFSRLVSSQISGHNGKSFLCDNCLNPFPTEESLNKHKEYCNTNECLKIELPKKGTMLNFKNYHRSEKVPFIVYADFECFIKPIQTCDLNPESSYTKQYQKHEPSSFCYYIVCFNHKVFAPIERKFIGKDAAQVFIKMLEEDIKMINNIPKKWMIFGEKERKQYEKETRC